MQYRLIKKLNTRISTFGMGCLRLPLEADANNDASRVDERQAIEMIHYAIEHGVNYLDTAFIYHGGRSEMLIGKALQQANYRQKTLIATKFPINLMIHRRYHELKANPVGLVEEIVDKQLRRLRTDCIDMYLLHCLNKRCCPVLQEVGMLEILQRLRAKGKIRFIGFSFHDSYKLFTQIVDTFDWDMCQIQLNILDQNFQAGVAGLKYAGAKGIPVTIMEPLRGGSLVQNIPEKVQSLWDSYRPIRSGVEWCFRWVSQFPEVMTVLSGVSTMEQLQQDITLFEKMLPHSMSQAELDLVDQVKEQYQKHMKVLCTGCGYCMPCPSGVRIPEIFRIYNNACMLNNQAKQCHNYASLKAQQTDASRCIRCGKCQRHCPQNIPVIEKLAEAEGFFSTMFKIQLPQHRLADKA